MEDFSTPTERAAYLQSEEYQEFLQLGMQALTFFKQGLFERARTLLNTALSKACHIPAKDEKKLAFTANLADCHLAMGDYVAAETMAQALLEELSDPADSIEHWVNARSLLGNIFLRAGRYELAEQISTATINRLSGIDPYHPKLVVEYMILGLVFICTGRQAMVEVLISNAQGVRDNATECGVRELADMNRAIDRMRQFSGRQISDTQLEQPESEEQAILTGHKSWAAFIVHDYETAGRCAAEVLRSNWRHPRMLLVWLISMRALDNLENVQAKEAVLSIANEDWIRRVSMAIIGIGNIDSALNSTSGRESCVIAYFAGVNALVARDAAEATRYFELAVNEFVAHPNLPEQHQAGLELEALANLAREQSNLTPLSSKLIEEKREAFAKYDFATCLIDKKTDHVEFQITPDCALLSVASLYLLGASSIAESMAGIVRKQLLHFPWYEKLLQVLMGKKSHHHLWEETSLDLKARGQVAFYGMLRMQADGRWQEAEFLERRVLEVGASFVERQILETSLANPLARLDGLALLVRQHSHSGRYELAEAAMRARIKIMEEMGDPPKGDLAEAFLSLAILLSQQGRHSEVLTVAAKGRSLSSYVLTSERALFDMRVGQILVEVRDLKNARLLLKQAVTQFGKAHSVSDAFVSGLNSLATVELIYGNLTSASHYLKMAIETIIKGGQEETVIHGVILDTQATLYRLDGEVGRALNLHRRARQIFDQLRTRRDAEIVSLHSAVLTNLVHIANTAWSANELSEARDASNAALSHLVKNLGARDSIIYELKRVLAQIALSENDQNGALDWLLEASKAADTAVADTIAMGNPELSLNYLWQARVELADLVPLACEQFPNDPVRLACVFNVVLRRKCLAAEGAIVARETVNNLRYPLLKARLLQLTEARNRLAKAMHVSVRGTPVDEENRFELQSQVQLLETTLAADIPELQTAQWLREVNVTKVLHALGDTKTLIEFVHTGATHLASLESLRFSFGLDAHYFAFLIPEGDITRIRLIDLGDAASIDSQIGLFVEHADSLVQSDCQEIDPQGSFQNLGRRLREKLFDPLIQGVALGSSVVIAVDGALSKLPFETLPSASGAWLGDDYHLSYVATLRDMAHSPTGRGGPSIVIGDPDFDLGCPHPVDINDTPFEPLPGTRDEAVTISGFLGVEPWLGADALKNRLKFVERPRILHIATHGFYSTDTDTDTDGEGEGDGDVGQTEGLIDGLLRKPLRSAPAVKAMWRCGLALAGANAVATEEQYTDAGSGILSAAEVLGMNLRGTELVVLSACETGLGDLAVVEGVMGLRRAFMLAGAQSVIVSLWAVPDEPTRELMNLFYKYLLRGASRLDALRAARSDLRMQWPSPGIWGAFVLFGETGPLQLTKSHGEASPIANDLFRIGSELHGAGKHAEASRVIANAIKAGAPVADALLQSAREAASFGEALLFIDQLLSGDSHAVAAWIQRAHLHLAIGELQTASEDFTRAIALDPADADLWYSRANTYADQNKNSLAMYDYNRALDIRPTFAHALVNRATVFMFVGDLDSALQDINASLKLNPTDEVAQFHCAQIYALKNQFQRARLLLEPLSKGTHSLAPKALDILQELDLAEGQGDTLQ
ncbi:MAG: CHAT domain-containing protein [Aquabacterium sp.]|uniref:CHAT domain-containing protein n=1 Tax=Aquabacterium sp. TaxID=1872578 RepID=UPI002718EFB5|nr:CHAT domain-containing protein [Aquabacterium sp.]MDO9006065.1 CHAT domain-containing protein [Aquabacterium sp.]